MSGTKDVSPVMNATKAWIQPHCVNRKAKFFAKIVMEKISGQQVLDQACKVDGIFKELEYLSDFS